MALKVLLLIFLCISNPHSSSCGREGGGRGFHNCAAACSAHTEWGNSHKLTQKYPRQWEMFGLGSFYRRQIVSSELASPHNDSVGLRPRGSERHDTCGRLSSRSTSLRSTVFGLCALTGRPHSELSETILCRLHFLLNPPGL